MDNKKDISTNDLKGNIKELVGLFEQTQGYLKAHAAKSTDTALAVRNWLFGWYIVEFEITGANRSELYGKKLIKNLSNELKATLGKGFSKRSLEQMRRFNKEYGDINVPKQISQDKITWEKITQAVPAQSEFGSR